MLQLDYRSILGTVAEWAQNISFVTLFVILFSSYQWIQLNKKNWRCEGPVILLTIHALCFYAYNLLVRENILLHPVVSPFFTYWSAILRLHEFLTIALMIRYRVLLSRDRIRHEQQIFREF